MEFPTRGDVDHLIDPQPLPSFARVRYEPPSEALDAPVAVTREELDELDVSTLEPGATVAIGVGSRGIHRIDDVAAAAVEWATDRGFDPVVVPAMGSHGGATAAGQREVLASLGVDEERLGAPIDARMDAEQVATVSVGDTDVPVYVAAAAREADGVVVVNRVKAHTNFTGPIESGLAKMTVVGLSKQSGAKAFHSTAISEGHADTLTPAPAALVYTTHAPRGHPPLHNHTQRPNTRTSVPPAAHHHREQGLVPLAT